jgi:hypothetical protein
LLNNFYISDEDLVDYIKKSHHYDNLKYEIKDSIVREYLKRKEIENEEKEKEDFITYLNNITNK